MEELKILVEMLSDVPNAVLWVAGGFLFYKLFIIGSVYSTIRFAIVKVPEGLQKLKQIKIQREFDEKMIERLRGLDNRINRLVISEHHDMLIEQLQRLIEDDHRMFINRSDIKWLKEVIDEKQKRERTPS